MVKSEDKLDPNAFVIVDTFMATIINLPNTESSEKQLSLNIAQKKSYEKAYKLFDRALKANSKKQYSVEAKIAPLNLIANRVVSLNDSLNHELRTELIRYLKDYSTSTLTAARDYYLRVIKNIEVKESKLKVIQEKMKELGISIESIKS